MAGMLNARRRLARRPLQSCDERRQLLNHHDPRGGIEAHHRKRLAVRRDVPVPMRRGRHHVGHRKQRATGLHFEDGTHSHAGDDELRAETRPGAVEELAPVAAPAGFGPSGQRDLDLIAGALSDRTYT